MAADDLAYRTGQLMGGANSGGESRFPGVPAWMVTQTCVSLADTYDQVLAAGTQHGRTWFGCRAAFGQHGTAVYSAVPVVLRLDVETVRPVPDAWLHVTGVLYGEVMPGQHAWFHVLWLPEGGAIGVMGWLD